MANFQFQGKRIQIDKATTTIVAVISVASIITVFSLVASRALISQWSFQSKVLVEKDKAQKQLIANLAAVDQIKTQHQAFAEAQTNVIGGSSTGTGPQDGDNDRIVLDALPSKYDFPALVTSLQKMLSNPAYKIGSITGTDDEVAQAAKSSSNLPQPVLIPFQISVSGSYSSMQNLIATLENSIRPISVKTISFDTQNQDSQSSNPTINMQITGVTYYQPSKNLKITTKEIK